MDPEEALAGDEIERFIERHDLTAEGAGVAPGPASPPQDLDVVALAGRTQPRDGPAGAPAAQGVAPVSAHHLDAAALGRPAPSLDPGAHRVAAAGHGASPPRVLPRSGARGFLGEGSAPWRRARSPRCWRAGCGPSDASSPRPPGVTCSCWRAGPFWRRGGGRSPQRSGAWASARSPALPYTIAC